MLGEALARPLGGSPEAAVNPPALCCSDLQGSIFCRSPGVPSFPCRGEKSALSRHHLQPRTPVLVPGQPPPGPGWARLSCGSYRPPNCGTYYSKGALFLCLFVYVPVTGLAEGPIQCLLPPGCKLREQPPSQILLSTIMEGKKSLEGSNLPGSAQCRNDNSLTRPNQKRQETQSSHVPWGSQPEISGDQQ